MSKNILIVDDHDDLASALHPAFTALGYETTIRESRPEALALGDLGDYQVIIVDLDNVTENRQIIADDDVNACVSINGSGGVSSEVVKAFKFCASNFCGEDFDENELRRVVETTLSYKLKFVDDERAMQNLRERIEFELPSSISVMHDILNYLLDRAAKMGIIQPDRSNVFVALDEAFVNAVKHGNRFDPTKLVRITAEVSPREARFIFEDEGEGFDVKSIPDPLDPTNLFKNSGRGVLLIHNIMDEVAYNERGNRLTMVKRPETANEA